MSKKQKSAETKETKTKEVKAVKECVCCQCLFRECGKNNDKSGWCGKVNAFVPRKDKRANDCENFNRKPTKK